MNTRAAKRRRSMARAARKQTAAALIPFLGVMIDKRTVRNHRYLRAHGLPCSHTVADVVIKSKLANAIQVAPPTRAYKEARMRRPGASPLLANLFATLVKYFGPRRAAA